LSGSTESPPAQDAEEKGPGLNFVEQGQDYFVNQQLVRPEIKSALKKQTAARGGEATIVPKKVTWKEALGLEDSDSELAVGRERFDSAPVTLMDMLESEGDMCGEEDEWLSSGV
jgi:hypothetical protein